MFRNSHYERTVDDFNKLSSAICRGHDQELNHSEADPDHSLLEKFENGGFTLKTHQMLSVHTAPKKFKNAKLTSHVGAYVYIE